MKPTFFISYSRKDSEIADEICAGLEKLGITYFIDRSNIKTAAEYMSIIASNLTNCEYLLFLGSQNSYTSKFAIKELLYAINNNINIVAYILDNSPMPPNVKLALSDINQRFIEETPIQEFCSSLLDLCGEKESSYFRAIPSNYIDELIKEFVSQPGIVSLDKDNLDYLHHASEIVYGIIPLTQAPDRFQAAFTLLKQDSIYRTGNYKNIAINLRIPTFDPAIVMGEMSELSSFVSKFGPECNVVWGCSTAGIRPEIFIILSQPH